MTQEDLSYEEEGPAKWEPYVAGPNAIDISPDGNGGVLKEIIKYGVGEYTPTSGCKVSVHYEGSLLDDTIFPINKGIVHIKFNLVKGQVIKAWDIGVATMKKDEVARFTCKSEYAYGKTGIPSRIAPEHKPLVFEVEMLDWQAEDSSSKKDGAILRHVIKTGEDHSTPNDGSAVDIHLVCEYNVKLWKHGT